MLIHCLYKHIIYLTKLTHVTNSIQYKLPVNHHIHSTEDFHVDHNNHSSKAQCNSAVRHCSDVSKNRSDLVSTSDKHSDIPT